MKTPFEKLSIERKRLEILKDALKWIKKKKLSPVSGDVFRSPDIKYSSRIPAKQALENVLNKRGGNCEVCARGALLVCTVLKVNKFSTYDLLENGGYFEPSTKVDQKIMLHFEPDQVKLMEDYFEGRGNIKSYNYRYHKYANDRTRLVKIFENAIKNKGIFKP